MSVQRRRGRETLEQNRRPTLANVVVWTRSRRFAEGGMRAVMLLTLGVFSALPAFAVQVDQPIDHPVRLAIMAGEAKGMAELCKAPRWSYAGTVAQAEAELSREFAKSRR